MGTSTRRGTTQVNLDLEHATPAQLLRVQRLARELRLTDQILSIDLDTVAVDPAGPAPAWTTLEGDKVSFAYNQMPEPHTRLDVAVWLGTNAHELGHVLYSPRKDSALMVRVIESEQTFMGGIAQFHNIAEDQRQERLILARFAPWRGYLTAALAHHLSPHTDAAWLLFAGRTWLPKEVRAEAKAQMIAAHGHVITDAVTRIIGEYQQLTDPGDAEVDAAWELLVELHDMFSDDMPHMPQARCVVMEGGSPETGQPEDGAPMTADEADASDGEGDDGGSGGDDDDDDDASDGTGDGTDANDADADADGSSGQDRRQDQPVKGGGDGSSSDATGESQPQDRKSQLRDAAKAQIEQDDDAQSDLDSIIDALDHGRGGGMADGEHAVGNYVEVTETARRLHVDVSDALLDLKDETEPGWQKRTDSGRLNVRRMLNPSTDADSMFDRYDAGMMDAAELDVVLLLDVSGSMGTGVFALGEATWAIHHAVDDLEGTCTVITWDSGPHRVIASAGERPDGRMFVPKSMGGTNPKSALSEAFRLMSGSATHNRLVVILTDGDWDYSAAGSEQVIRAMNEEGIVTVIGLLGKYAGTDTHECRFGAQIADPIELARLFKRVALERIGSWH